MTENSIDVVIPYHSKDSDIIGMCIDGCIKNVPNLDNIYVITNDTDFSSNNFQLINENKLFEDQLSKKHIESVLRAKQPGLLHRSGWIFQQFIKMGSSYAIPNLKEHYLVVDADVIFLKKVLFLKKGRMLLAKTKEYHQPHFNCCEKLLGEPVNHNHIFVAHHMLVRKSIMLELLHNIESRFNKTWYDAILDNINIDGEQGSMIAEYELYGHYLENNYPEQLAIRKLRYVQRFKRRYLLPILLNQVYYVAIHSYKKPENNPKTDPDKYNLLLKLIRKKLKKTRKYSYPQS